MITATGFPAALPAAAARRLFNHISRAFRSMHGSRTGLKTIVRTITADMLAAGVAAETIMTTFENCILAHPARLAYDPRHVLTGKTHSAVLVELTHACAAEVIGNAEVVVLAGIGAAVAQSPVMS